MFWFFKLKYWSKSKPPSYFPAHSPKVKSLEWVGELSTEPSSQCFRLYGSWFCGTTLLRCCNLKAATDNTEGNGHGRVPGKRCLRKRAAGFELQFANLWSRKDTSSLKQVLPRTHQSQCFYLPSAHILLVDLLTTIITMSYSIMYLSPYGISSFKVGATVLHDTHPHLSSLRKIFNE